MSLAKATIVEDPGRSPVDDRPLRLGARAQGEAGLKLFEAGAHIYPGKRYVVVASHRSWLGDRDPRRGA